MPQEANDSSSDITKVASLVSILMLLFLPSTLGQAQQPGVDEVPSIEDSAQLVGKKINVKRLPLCEPGTYKTDLTHAGMQATVISAKRSKTTALPASVLERLSPDMRTLMVDQQKAALLLLRFEDGAERDTCAALGPKRLSDYVELVPGETLTPVARDEDAARSANSQPHDELTDDEVNAALRGNGRDHWVEIEDMGLMAAQGARVPAIALYLPEALLAIRSESARKQFLKYEPTSEDRRRALTVTAQGFVAETLRGGCNSITRVVLLSDPSGKVIKEAYLSERISETWRNTFGASNLCDTLKAKLSLDDVREVRAAAEGHEFYIAVFSGSVMTKMYKIKHKHQSKLGLS